MCRVWIASIERAAKSSTVPRNLRSLYPMRESDYLIEGDGVEDLVVRAAVAVFLAQKKKLEIVLETKNFCLLGLDLIDYVSHHVPFLTTLCLLQVPQLHGLVLMLRVGSTGREHRGEGRGHFGRERPG